MINSAYLKGIVSNIHRPGNKPDIFLFSTPRSGSTFLMEVLFNQPGVKIINEPLSLRSPVVPRELGATSWAALTTLDNRETLYRAYFDKMRSNRLPELNRPFYWRTGRFLTHRLVFKIIHGGEDMIGWFQKTFGGDIVILVRHPIPTTFSHKQYPRLPYFLKQPGLRRLLTDAQVLFATRIIEQGDTFAQGVVNWCLQNVALLAKHLDPSWAVVSYEDLTIHPRESVAYLERKLDLSPVADLERLIRRPSGSTVQSDAKTREFLKDNARSDDRMFLVSKWCDQASEEQIQTAFEILSMFDIDFYEHGNLFPADKYRVPGVVDTTAASVL